jgi:Domain of unknown function (DUF6321)
MLKDTSLHSSPQLALVEQQGVAVVLTPKQVISLYKKSQYSEIPFDTLKEVYKRGYAESLSEQEAFNRVNSFIYGGRAAELDEDLNEKRGLWDNIHAKQERIKHGSGEHMRKPGSKGAPTPEDLKRSQSEQYTGAEKVSNNSDDASSRFVGTDSLTDVYKKATPGYTKTIKRVIREHCGCKADLEETEAWQKSKYKNPEGGMTKKGVDVYRREHPGSKLKTAVTTEPSKLKAGSKAANRRKSFCARMSGVEGPMKKPNGEPTRKALALRKWNC